MSRGSLEKTRKKVKKARPFFGIYLYAAIIATAKQTQPADKANHKIDFDKSFIFSFPFLNIF